MFTAIIIIIIIIIVIIIIIIIIILFLDEWWNLILTAHNIYRFEKEDRCFFCKYLTEYDINFSVHIPYSLFIYSLVKLIYDFVQ